MSFITASMTAQMRIDWVLEPTYRKKYILYYISPIQMRYDCIQKLVLWRLKAFRRLLFMKMHVRRLQAALGTSILMSMFKC